MTTQQANELCPHCGKAPRHLERNPGFYDERVVCDTCHYSLPPEVWNRRAPAPTSEPGARDAVVAVARKILQEALDGVVVHPCDEFDESVRAKGLYGHTAELYAALATPASPAVPEPIVMKPMYGDEPPEDWQHPSTIPAVPAAPLAHHPICEQRGSNPFCPACSAADPAPLVAQASPWMPIETAPKDGTSIMLYAPVRTYQGKPVSSRVAQGEWTEWQKTSGEYHGTTGEYLGKSVQDDGACWMSWDGGFLEELPPTHWQPLPTAPEASPPVEDAQRIVAGKVEDADKLDAERYRWLRDPENTDGQSYVAVYGNEDLDRQIDNAIAEQTQGAAE